MDEEKAGLFTNFVRESLTISLAGCYNQMNKLQREKGALHNLMARVGLLEDNTRISKLCITMLNYVGHDVVAYNDALACLDSLFLLDTSPLSTIDKKSELAVYHSLPIDVLILDLHLPGMPGLEVLRILRASPRTRSLPLVMCTAATSSEIDRAMLIAPEAVLVEKPFKLQVLISAIAGVLQTSAYQS